MTEASRTSSLLDQRIHWFQRMPWLILLVVLVLSVLQSASTGSFPVSGRQALHVILDHATDGLNTIPGWSIIENGWIWFASLPVISDTVSFLDDRTTTFRTWLTPEYSGREASVVWDIRMPRIFLGAAVGGLIALSATLLQGAFRNPLADPGLIGISSAGAWCALLMSFASWGYSLTLTQPVAAFFGCLAITLLLWYIANHNGTIEIVTLILAGIAIQITLTAAIGITNAINGDVLLTATSYWATGGLDQALWIQVKVAWVAIAIGAILALPLVDRLNVPSLGDRETTHQGIDVSVPRCGIVILISALLAIAVAYAGAIAFVGLIVPQLMCAWLGPDHRRVLPSGVVAGAIVVVLADLAARTIADPIEIGIGVVLSIIGGPLFVALLLRIRREGGGV